MSTAFPLALDALTNPVASDSLAGHAAQHANLNDAVEALQTKVGVNGATDPASIDYQLGDASADPLAFYILAKA